MTDTRRTKRSGTLTAGLLATTALVAVPALAQDATWSANPQSIYFEQGANWVGGSVPTGTATFGATSGRYIEIAAPLTMSGWTFTADQPGYSINAFRSLTFTGAGISNAGSLVGLNAIGGLTFRNASTTAGTHINIFATTDFLDTSRAGGTIHNFYSLNFRDSSSAGTARITNSSSIAFSGNSSAGSATISNFSGNTATFRNGSTAGSARINNSSGGTTTFGDDSTAGSADITNFNGSSTTFNGSSSAGSATITNLLSSALIFNNSSTAGSATITNETSSSVTFNNSSTAGSAAITNSGEVTFYGTSTAGSATLLNDGFIRFRDTSSAGSAAITNRGFIHFLDGSSAGSATIGNDYGVSFFGTSTAAASVITNTSTLFFNDSSTAGSATITNNSGSSVNFQNTSSAGSATITNNSGSHILFNHTSSAGSATINNGQGAQTFFYASSNAGSATLANSGTVIFNENSRAGTAAITNSNVGTVIFHGFSSAVSASIINSGYMSFGVASNGGNATITNASGGNLIFSDVSSAGSATISNAHALYFSGFSSAGNAAITNAHGALMGFTDVGTAGTATITNAGELDFMDASTTGQSTITSTGVVTLLTSDTTGTATVIVHGPDGVLRGYGSVGNTTVGAGATLMPMAGTLRVNGNLTMQAGSIFAATPYGLASITGTAALGGATLRVGGMAGWQSRSQTVLEAAGGVIGTFVLDPAGAGRFATVLYGANDVTVTVAPYRAGAALGDLGAGNARRVAAAIDRSLDGLGGSPPPAAFNAILALYGAPLANALNSMSGEAATGTQSMALTGASTFLGIMLDPMAGARGATAAAPGSSLIEMADTGRTPAGRVAAGWSVWTKAFGQAGRTASDAATGAAGTASSLYGVAAGADRLISPDTLIGFALAGGGTAYGLGTRGTGSGDFAQVGLYGSSRLGPGYVSAALAYGWNRFDVSRSAGLGPVETYRSAPTVHTFGGRIEAGRRFGGAALAATPYAALEVIGASAAGYRESWAAPDTGAFALAYAARTYATARAEAGLRVDSLRAVAPTADLLTFARIAYAWQGGTQRSAEASFQQLANSGFTVFGARASTHTALASLGAELRLAAGTRLAGSLDAELGDRHRSLRANLSLRQSW